MHQKHRAMTGIPAFATVAFYFWVQGDGDSISSSRSARGVSAFEAPKVPRSNALLNSKNSYLSVLVASLKSTGVNIRSFQTSADQFFQENKKIPAPNAAHVGLTDLTPGNVERVESETREAKNILVIGDVHGCYDELLELHAKAVQENGSRNFSHVILVGDLCNKGPDSAKVIRHVRITPDWFSVRGNHDDGALAAALGDTKRLQKKTYQWVRDETKSSHGEETSSDARQIETHLSDEDIHWLAQLPYTIQIPGELLGEDEDTIIVHAGLIPNSKLEDQEKTTMTTIRDLLPRCNESGEFTHFEYHSSKGGKEAVVLDSNSKISCNEAVTWASAWKGPQRVIFGHDARRKLQRHDWAIGLDTGAVYGGKLTGIILPEQKLVSVQSKEYSPIIDGVKKYD